MSRYLKKTFRPLLVIFGLLCLLQLGFAYQEIYTFYHVHLVVRLLFAGVFLGMAALVVAHHLRLVELNQQLQADEKRLQLFIKHTPAAVAMLDRDMRYIAASDHYIEAYKIDCADIRGMSHYDIFPMLRDMPGVVERHQLCLTGHVIHREADSFVFPDGRTECIKYDLRPWYAEPGIVGGLTVFSEIITERRETLRRLRESENRLERAVRGGGNVIWEWDIVTGDIYLSPFMFQLLGYGDNDVPPSLEGHLALLHPDDTARISTALEKHLQSREPYRTEYRYRMKNGEYLWVESRGQAEWNDAGKAVRMAGSVSDITERRRLEGLKQEFVYTVTHELRTPLTALKGAIDVLPHLLGKDIPDRVARMLDLALAGGDRLMQLIDDLLDVGKAENALYAMQHFAVGPFLQHVIDANILYGQKYGVTFALSDVPATLQVHADRQRLHQVMTNLLSNAAKFSPPGGVVDIMARNDDGACLIAVRDHGPGIPAHFHDRVFHKFTQGAHDKGGTGLGLNISKTMVEHMGGMIWFESEEGAGATFFVKLQL